jgi:F-type H+-transporting ATPase subunit gamma
MSQTLEGLQHKIKSGKDLGSIVSTMKSLAATNVQQYDRAVESLTQYFSTIEMGLSVVLKDIPIITKQSENKEKNNALVIVFGSDHSLVGKFNEQIVEYSINGVKEELGLSKHKHIFYFSIGEQVTNRLTGDGIKLSQNFELPSSVLGITDAVFTILSEIETYQSEHQVEEVILVYNQPKKGASYNPTNLVLLPVDLEKLSQRNKKWDSRSLPTYQLDSKELLSFLLKQYFFIVIYRTIAHSLAAENSARLIAMQAAEKNIDELLVELNTQYQQARQTEITEELLDIVAGFRTLRKSDV